MKILLVEDSATIRYVMCQFIGEAGHEAIIAQSGEEALQILDTTRVDMVIMDVEMPGLDGFETTHLIREWLGDHWIPIIFVTGKSEAKSLEEGIAAGGDDYLIKPVNQTILNAKIQAMERITAMRDQLAELNRELTVLSQYDGLSQLYNRRTFEEKAKTLWAQATRQKTPLALVLLDIDHFKAYNDCYGHQAGDDCIAQVASTLARSLSRTSDLVARYGGEEFVFLLPDTHEHGARHVCERIRQSVEAMNVRHRDSSCSSVVTVSIGASVTKFTTGTSLEAQIAQADKALYLAKDRGRNCIVVRRHHPERKVVVLEEDEPTLDSIRELLSGHCTVIQAHNVAEAIALAEEYQPDLFLVDAERSPNAPLSCRTLKEHPKTRSLPILLATEGTPEAIKKFGADTHVDDWVQKPLQRDRMVAKVNGFL